VMLGLEGVAGHGSIAGLWPHAGMTKIASATALSSALMCLFII